MKNKLVYHFDSQTGQYLGSGFAEPCQVIAGEFLQPAFSTRLDPPDVPAGHAAFFNVEADAWELRALTAVAPPISPASELTLPERKALLLAAVDLRLDSLAQAMGYTSMQTAVSYADEDAVPKFQEEGRALRRWRSLVYAACYELLAAFEAGEVDEPTVEALLDALPAFGMPAPEVAEEGVQ